ncbi:MAG: hypothetical protein IFNCLDLE_02459 [Ignavibacteriaceae bacterium]|nr:hypothetical protein [Ignavibacteriaceae bacterium]OQY79012.1 MAG: hypothetical protein B6D45_01595 [Ignavibacteriales bacterium UTCHB3]
MPFKSFFNSLFLAPGLIKQLFTEAKNYAKFYPAQFFFLSFGVLLQLLFTGCESVPPLEPFNSGLPPAVPENLQVTTATDGVVVLRWWQNIDPEFSSYKIYRSINDSLNFSFHREVRTNFFREEGLFYDSTYRYALTAVGRNGLESKHSFVVVAKPVNNLDPVLPSYINLHPVNFENKLMVSFEWSKDDNPDLLGLEVYRSVTSGFTPTENDLVTVLDTLNDTDSLALIAETNYFYRFRVKDRGGRFSPFSEEKTAFLYPMPEKIFPVNEAAIPLFDLFIIKGIHYPLDYGIVLYESALLNEVWRSPLYFKDGQGEVYIPFIASYISLNKKYYWRVVAYLPGTSTVVAWSDLSSFQLTRYN